ncbi:MAG: hypothetical protein Q4A84_03155 [Neisseria sp.]|uniref:hypothetical protein n=1 Tax=Neisseria sp. TaxID=192066 RepID=UPI0026DCCE88|nr:hypothetical protein [Neisseria sp.]MDO4640688.1 hypothetical protein [Neisseria sp.]
MFQLFLHYLNKTTLLFQTGFSIECLSEYFQYNLKGFASNLGKTYFIVAMALGVASSSGFALRTLTDTLADGMSEIMRGDSKAGSACLTKSTDSFVGCKIDQNLTITQSIIGLINKIKTCPCKISLSSSRINKLQTALII